MTGDLPRRAPHRGGTGLLTVLVDGDETALVPATDRGLSYGDGVFETLRVDNGRPEFWRRHLARLEEGCQRLGIPFSEAATLEVEVRGVAQTPGAGVVKIIQTRGSSGRGYAPPAEPRPRRIVMAFSAGEAPGAVRLGFCRTPLAEQPLLSGLKHLNRLEQVLARAELSDLGVDDGVMADTSGRIVSGTMANLFIVKGGVVATPALHRAGVKGIMRGAVIDALGTMGRDAMIRDLSRAEVENADGIFLTSSVQGIRPVSALIAGERRRNLAPVTFLDDVRQRVAALARAEDGAY